MEVKVEEIGEKRLMKDDDVDSKMTKIPICVI